MLTVLRDAANTAFLTVDPAERNVALSTAAEALKALRPDLFNAPAKTKAKAPRATFGLTEACRALKRACLAVAGGEAIVITNDLRLTFPCSAPDGIYDPELALRQRKPVLPGNNLCPRTCDLVDFTHPDPGPALGTVAFNRDDLAYVVNGVSDEETRYYLCGVFFTNEMAATDGYILLTRPCAGYDAKAIVPTEAVKMALKLGLSSLTFHKDCVTAPGFFAKLIDGRFPDYESIKPKDCELSPEIRVRYVPEMVRGNTFLLSHDSRWAVHDSETKTFVAGDPTLAAEIDDPDKPVVIPYDGAYIATCCGKKDFTIRLKRGPSRINGCAVIMPKRGI